MGPATTKPVFGCDLANKITLIKIFDWLSLLIGHPLFQFNSNKTHIYYTGFFHTRCLYCVIVYARGSHSSQNLKFSTLKAPITTEADDIFCNIFPNFPKNQKKCIFLENPLL